VTGERGADFDDAALDTAARRAGVFQRIAVRNRTAAVARISPGSGGLLTRIPGLRIYRTLPAGAAWIATRSRLMPRSNEVTSISLGPSLRAADGWPGEEK
jgi:hypothetical protein